MQERKSCQSCMRNISAYIDEELSPSLMDEVKKHLAICSSCRAEHASHLAAMTTLASLIVPEPHRRLDADVLRLVSHEPRSAGLRRLIPAPLYAAAIGLFIGVFLARGVVQQTAVVTIESDRVIMQIMDVFSPSPPGSFSNAYFSMVANDTHQATRAMQ